MVHDDGRRALVSVCVQFKRTAGRWQATGPLLGWVCSNPSMRPCRQHKGRGGRGCPRMCLHMCVCVVVWGEGPIALVAGYSLAAQQRLWRGALSAAPPAAHQRFCGGHMSQAVLERVDP